MWDRVEAKGLDLGLRFDWWQSQLGKVCLGYGADGKYAATVGGIGLSIPRQVGKTYFVMATLVILCILFPGLQVIWTSHHLRTTNKTLTTIQGLCRRKKIAPHIKNVRTSHGEGQVEFVNGSIIMFGARSQGFGRGFDEIDVEVFDEAQILDTKALEDMIAATNQARHPHGALLFFMGTPPRPGDKSESFTLRRAKATSGSAEGAVWLEIGAPPDSDPDDRSVWPEMNPSYPSRTPLESMLRLRENLADEESWNREGRGVWDQSQLGGVIPADAWDAVKDPASVPVDRLALGVEVGPDLAWASVAVAGLRADGSWHVALEADQNSHGAGVAWLVPYVAELVELNPQIRSVVVDVAGPVKALVEQRGVGQKVQHLFAGVPVRCQAIRSADLGSTCANLLSGVVTGDVRHMDQPQLSVAALSASKRAIADTGMWVWSRRTATSDITPIQAATLALYGAQATKVTRPSRAKSSGRRVMTG